jgi:hypothetical protein
MLDWTVVRPEHVCTAIGECDRIGSREFLARYRFGRADAYTLWHHGQEYDATAVLGVAYLHATGRAATADELTADPGAAAQVLSRLGFDVVVDEELAASTPTRTRTVPKARRSAPEPEVKICPRCFMALPATGVCDTCD